MIQLTTANVQLDAEAANKAEAIRDVGRLLVAGGFISSGYIESMLGREGQANTYLGNGIAIPHGMQKDSALIRRTGIAVVQIPAGVTWNPGETVHLVVGIAARSDEHLGILANLTDVLDDPAIASRLAQTDDPADIIATLNRSREPAAVSPAPTADTWSDARYVDVVVVEGVGLHARPASFFVDVASQFASEIRVQHGGKAANGKAMASLLKLGVEGGSTIRILARGTDADAALQALREAVEAGLGEEEEQLAPLGEIHAWTPVSAGRVIAGVAASPGLAIGPVYQYQHTRIVVSDVQQEIGAANKQLQQALVVAREQLGDIYEKVKERAGRSQAAIFRAHQAFLDDPDLIAEVHARMRGGHGTAWSWNAAIEARVADMRRLGDPLLAMRAADLQDVGRRVLRLLTGVDQGEPEFPGEPVILAAEDLTPSDTARLDPKRTLGLCTAAGGPTSHTAIIARSLGIPAVVAAGVGLLEQPNSVVIILDGSTGRLYVEPSEADLASARTTQQNLQTQRDAEYETRYQPALTTDGHRVEVVANIGTASEAAQAVDAGAEGVGLMRTEFLFLGRTAPPSEEEQFAAYRTMTQALNGLPLIIRTLDIGGDKEVPYLALPAEANPFLGVRGIRLCLRHPELFEPQLRAIYRASETGPVKIMFPMIATLEDLREARAVAERVRAEVGVPPVEIGIMVEVPSAALMAEAFAKEADFFSIGTNDLTQYVLAIDRVHPVLAKYVDGLHPAVLRMIERVAQAARAAGKWTGVCGGVAGDPLGAVILTGLGVSELSMSIPSIAAVKARLRQLSHAQARALAKKALACTTAAEVRELALG